MSMHFPLDLPAVAGAGVRGRAAEPRRWEGRAVCHLYALAVGQLTFLSAAVIVYDGLNYMQNYSLM